MIENFYWLTGKQKHWTDRVNTEMTKTLYTLLFSFIAFYALLFASLLLRACAGYVRARRPELPKLQKVSSPLAMAHRSRAWTNAVWRGKLAQEMQMMEQVESRAAATSSESSLIALY